MNERVVPKMTNFCVAYTDVAGGVPMRGVSICPWMDGSRTMQEQLSRSGSFGKLSNSPAKAGPMSEASALAAAIALGRAGPMSEAIALGRAGPMSEAIALGLTCVPRLELDGPTFRHFESQHDSPRINQRLLN